jgi:hypothetical protein
MFLMKDIILVALDVACIVWIVAALSDPLGAFAFTVKLLAYLLGGVYLGIPIVAFGWMALNGVDGAFGKTCLVFFAETIGLAFLLSDLFTLKGLANAARTAAGVYCATISVPCWFIMGTIAYWCW